MFGNKIFLQKCGRGNPYMGFCLKKAGTLLSINNGDSNNALYSASLCLKYLFFF